MRDLDLLATFHEVYRSGSVTAAAAARGLSQPAASAQVARLEGELGGPLFIRTARGMRPTARADELERRVGAALDRLDGALGSGAQTHTGATPVRGTVRLGGAPDVMALRVVPALAPLAGEDLRFELTLGLPDDLLDDLDEGRLDVVVSGTRPRRRGVRAHAWVDEELVLVAAPTLARSLEPTRLEADPAAALERLPFVVYDEGPVLVRRYWRTSFDRLPRVRAVLTVPDLRAVLAAVVAGAGAAVLPRYVAAAALSAGSVVAVLDPPVAPLNTLYLVTAAADVPGPATAHVLARLDEAARAWDSL